MAGRTILLRGRVGVALVGALLIGGVGTLVGASTAWHPELPLIGSAQATATQGLANTNDATATAQSAASVTPTATSEESPTISPTAAPTATTNPVGSTIRGTVISIDVNAKSLVMSRLGVHYTIQIDDKTVITGITTQFSSIQPTDRISVTVAAVEDTRTYLAAHINVSPPDT